MRTWAALASRQVETADCIKNMEEIAALPGIDILFLGQNDLCMSMGLFAREYVFPAMYFSKELNEATETLVSGRRSAAAQQPAAPQRRPHAVLAH